MWYYSESCFLMIDFAKFTNLDFGQILGKVPPSKARPSNTLPAWAGQRPSFFKIKDPARLEGRERALQAQLMPLTLLLVVAMVIGFRHGLGCCPEPAAVVGLAAEWC